MPDCTSARSRYDDAMSDGYRQLLDATIQHLEGLKSRGVRHVAVAPETLRALAQPPPPKTPVPNLKPAVPATPGASPAATLFQKPAASAPATPLVNPPQTFPVPPKKTTTFVQPESIAAPVSQSAIEKAAAFTALREKVLGCVKCPHLASSRTTVVFGVGSIDAQLMFVGEAPGADEDESGEPFVGRAGQLLTKIIETTGLKRGDVYIANILKCRPDTPGQAAGNRPPTPEERATCIPYLQEQIDLIKPRAIVALGATAVEGLLGKTLGITKLRGNWQTYRGIPLMPTYHPAYLLRNQAMTEKRKVWEDILKVMEKLAMPISEKQRNFFLKT